MRTPSHDDVAHHMMTALQRSGLVCKHLAAAGNHVAIEVSNGAATEVLRLTMPAAHLFVDWVPMPMAPPKPDYTRLYEHCQQRGREAVARLGPPGPPWPGDLDRDKWERVPDEDVPNWVFERGQYSNTVVQNLFSTDPAADRCTQRMWTSRPLCAPDGRRHRVWFVQPVPDGFSEKAPQLEAYR